MIKVHSKDSGTSGSIQLTVNASSILEFTLIDDKDNDLTQDELIKYVNLPVDSKFVDASNGTVTGTHELGDDVWCKVKFSKPGKYTFDILLENNNAVVYTQTEKDRNVNFTHTRVQTINCSTNNYGEVIIRGAELFLSQAGGNTYTLNIECNGEDKVPCKTKILTKRMLFYSEIKMKNPDASGFLSSIRNDISNLVDQYKSHHIELIRSFETTIEYMPNIERSFDEAFRENVKQAYSNSPENKGLDPFCLAITYAGHLAAKSKTDMLVFNVPVGPGENPVMIDITGDNITYAPLWYKIDHPDDPNKKEWYIDCKCTMINNVNMEMVSGESFPIPPDKCTQLSFEDNQDNCYVVSIDVSHLPPGLADISLMVYSVSTMRRGISFKGTNMICLCTKVWWNEVSLSEQNTTMIHEVGHRVGMVPNGTISLDMGNYYYTKRGHFGSHCHSGISPNITTNYTADNDSDANCIMYGISRPTIISFCYDCASKIKKTDLTKGVII